MNRDTNLHRFFHKKEPAVNYLAQRVTELNSQLTGVDPRLLAHRTGATFHPAAEGTGELRLLVWGQEVAVDFPEFSGRYVQSGAAVDTFTMALLAYYFNISDGSPETGEWISFSELPDGKFYTQAFQGYSGNELAKQFVNDLEGFSQAAASLGGVPVSMGDGAFAFRVLPFASLLVVCWLGDEEFPPSYRVLFDASAGRHLSTDACAVVGSNLTSRLIKAYKAQ